MNERYKISVLMPCYNVEGFVYRAIETMLSQTYRNIELLIMDDASKDDTVNVIRTFSDVRIKFYRNEKNRGYLKTCNKLFDLAQGEFVAFQDADDYSDRTRLECQMLEFDKDPKLTVCGTNLTAIHENGTEMFCSNYFCDQASIAHHMLEGDFYSIMPNSFLFKREILVSIGTYNEYWDRIGAEDYYWTWLIMEKHKLINIKPALYYYRHNPRGVTGDWSDSRRKIHNRQLLPYLLNIRENTGTDPIENKDWATLDAFIGSLDKPYIEDPSLFYREIAKRDFYLGNKKRALKFMLKAVKRGPFRSENYRNLFYYLRTRAKQELA